MRVAVARSLCLASLALAGCADNPYMLQSKNKQLQTAQVAMQQKVQEVQSRATTLDADNQELETLLAQSRQRGKLLEDQLAAVRDQLTTTTAQLSELRDQRLANDKQTDAVMTSARRRTGATITANSSLKQNLASLNLPGIEVRPDGDVIRIELPAAQLFQTGSGTLAATGLPLVDTVGAELAQSYPDQIIGIEGHTDAEANGPANFISNQQLSAARALAVYQQLAGRGALRPQQLFVVGHGGNHPVVSNATPPGRRRNQRIELVVYPEKAP